MKALVLEKAGELDLRDIELEETLGPKDVKIAPVAVGVCGSDLEYYRHGKIGPFEVTEPMVLGHEASGKVLEVGSEVTSLKPGDRVCMEPGIADPESKESWLGMYNLDPSVAFWATPPIHGVMRETVVHPEAFTFKLPEPVSFGAGAMVEPLAVGMHGVTKAGLSPGDTVVVTGAGTIGMVTALSALAGGAAQVIITDIVQQKLDIAEKLGPVTGVNVKNENLKDRVMEITGGWGAEAVFEASGSAKVGETLLDIVCPGGTIVYIGMPSEPVSFDVVGAQTKEVTVKTVFRYAHVYARAIALLGSGRIDVDPLITESYEFNKAVEGFTYANDPKPESVKVQIEINK
jgi:D-xylulose reductase